MYKKLQFHNHQNLGYVTLTQPLQKDYGTESTWLTMPENVVKMCIRDRGIAAHKKKRQSFMAWRLST